MKFLKRRSEDRLYRQWVQHDGLPSEAIPQREVVGNRRMGEEKRDRLRPYKEKFVDMIRKILKV